MNDTDDMEMPTACDLCGEWFDLNDGHPCHKCHIVYCPQCARDTDDGWRCLRCVPDESERPLHAASRRRTRRQTKSGEGGEL
jgi:hypothetical protein